MTKTPQKSPLTLVDSVFTKDQLLKILQRTPKGHIYTRPAKGGGQWDYVTGVYVKKVLNFVFGWMWSFDVKSAEEKYGQIVVTGRLTIHKNNGRILIWKEDTGRADIKMKRDNSGPLDYGNDQKAAITDCLKRCAAQFGIASDIYGKNEFQEINLGAIEAIEPPEKQIKKEVVNPIKAEDGDIANIRKELIK
jgi:recombination DNA repair RAD52 pathway protein